MEGFSDIDAPDARKGIERALRIKGGGVLPNQVSLAQVSYVFDLASGGFLAGEYSVVESADLAVAASASASLLGIGPTGFTFAGALGTSLLALNQENCRVLASALRLDFDAAGALAFNGKVVRYLWSMRALSGGANFNVWNDEFTVATAQIAYRKTLNAAFWKGLVPMTLALTAGFSVNDGTVFPANTTARLSFAVVKQGIGVEVPF